MNKATVLIVINKKNFNNNSDNKDKRRGGGGGGGSKSKQVYTDRKKSNVCQFYTINRKVNENWLIPKRKQTFSHQIYTQASY